MIGVIIWAIVIGAIIGALGRLVVPGRQNISIWLTIGDRHRGRTRGRPHRQRSRRRGHQVASTGSN